MRPWNHGFTVCWSDDGTSVRWLAINDRTWPETTLSTMRSCSPGRVKYAVSPDEATMAKASDAAIASGRQTACRRGGASIASSASVSATARRARSRSEAENRVMPARTVCCQPRCASTSRVHSAQSRRCTSSASA
jgi:hypothetical protein